jgi:hypothetical protein
MTTTIDGLDDGGFIIPTFFDGSVLMETRRLHQRIFAVSLVIDRSGEDL